MSVCLSVCRPSCLHSVHLLLLLSSISLNNWKSRHRTYCICLFLLSLASGAIDYDALDSVLTFGPGIRRICRNISIINDPFYEDDEDFIVFLNTSDPSVTVDPTRMMGEATILDDDGT